jgi:hypothetical protein
MYCRIALRTVSRMGLICDQPTWDAASWLTYSGQGLSYFGQPLLMDGRGWFMYLGQEVGTPRLPRVGWSLAYVADQIRSQPMQEGAAAERTLAPPPLHPCRPSRWTTRSWRCQCRHPQGRRPRRLLLR